mgnify:CR=1 FL=1
METARRVSVAHVFLIRDGQVLLLNRQNTGHDDGSYGLPAGKIERGETAEAAALREAFEECGAVIEPGDLRMIGVMQIGAADKSGDERIDFFFAAERWSGEIVNREPDKCAGLDWFAVDGLPGNTTPFIREAWDNARRGRWYGSYGLEEAKNAALAEE